jgi:hypothetical protein
MKQANRSETTGAETADYGTTGRGQKKREAFFGISPMNYLLVGCARAKARAYQLPAGAAKGAVIGAEGFLVRRSIASCSSPTSKGFASIMSTSNSS